MSLRESIAAVDRSVYRVERALAGGLFLLLAGLMFVGVALDVLFTRDEGRLAVLVRNLLAAVGKDPGEGFTLASQSSAGLVINVLLAWLLCYGALRTMTRAGGPTPRLRALALAALLTLGLAALLALLHRIFPHGLVWAPDVAMACVLWVSFLGSSLATYEKRHLAVEMGEKIWPRVIAHHVRALSLVAAAFVCVVLLYLAWKSGYQHFLDWFSPFSADKPVPDAERLSGQETPIPMWAVFAIFPYAFLVMALRLLAQAFAAVEGGPAPIPPPDALPDARPDVEAAQ